MQPQFPQQQFPQPNVQVQFQGTSPQFQPPQQQFGQVTINQQVQPTAFGPNFNHLDKNL